MDGASYRRPAALKHLLFPPAGNVTIPITKSDIYTNSLLGKFNGAGGEKTSPALCF